MFREQQFVREFACFFALHKLRKQCQPLAAH